MTDIIIEKTLTDAFLNLHQFMVSCGYAGDPLIVMKNGKPTNVSLPNVAFTEPADKRYFVLSFLPNEPEPAGLGTYAENAYTGLFQIDIIVPLGGGKAEAENKFNWISRLFGRGKVFGDVMIRRAYRAMEGAVPNMPYYRTVVRVEWYATLPKD